MQIPEMLFTLGDIVNIKEGCCLLSDRKMNPWIIYSCSLIMTKNTNQPQWLYSIDTLDHKTRTNIYQEGLEKHKFQVCPTCLREYC